MDTFAFLEQYSGQFGLDPGGEIEWQSVIYEVLAFAGHTAGETVISVFMVIGISVVTAMIFQGESPNSRGMRKYLFLILTAVCAYPIVQDFLTMVGVAKTGVSDLTALMVASIPALTSLDLSSSAGVFLLITQVTGALMTHVFLPLILCQTALGICDALTEHFTLTGIRQTLKSVFNWGLGAVMLVFGVVSALSGAVAGTGATVAGRSLRYAGNLIPVVGRYLSESAEMIYASSAVIRNAGGIGVCVAVLACVMEPFVRILIYVLIYKLVAFCIRPFAGTRLTGLTGAIGEGLAGLAGITILTASIALINVAVIIRNAGAAI